MLVPEQYMDLSVILKYFNYFEAFVFFKVNIF